MEIDAKCLGNVLDLWYFKQHDTTSMRVSHWLLSLKRRERFCGLFPIVYNSRSIRYAFERLGACYRCWLNHWSDLWKKARHRAFLDSVIPHRRCPNEFPIGIPLVELEGDQFFFITGVDFAIADCTVATASHGPLHDDIMAAVAGGLWVLHSSP